jgi:hypothetical protein
VVKIKNFIKSFFKTNKYVIPLDQFLKDFSKSNPRLSKSQQFEREKYKRIYQLRDNKITVAAKTSLWDKF